MHWIKMNPLYNIASFFAIFILLGMSLVAKETAVLTQLKGKVTVTDSNQVAQQANLEIRLHIGDKIEAAGKGEARILYYTGEEAIVRPGKAYYIKDTNTTDSFLANLGSALSGLLWGKERAGAIAGATRSFEESAWPFQNIYPRSTKILEARPIFRWQAKPGANTKGLFIELVNDQTGERVTFSLDSPSEMKLPKTIAPLQTDVRYRWRMIDDKENILSASASFSVISKAEKTMLEAELKKVREICQGDEKSIRFYLLTAAVYWHYQLAGEAEKRLLASIQSAPSFQAHKMLAQIYRHTGQFQAAKTQEGMAIALKAEQNQTQ